MVLLQALVVQVQLGDICQTQVVHTTWHLQHNAKVNIFVQLKAPGLVKQAVRKLPDPTITVGLSKDCNFAVYNTVFTDLLTGDTKLLRSHAFW